MTAAGRGGETNNEGRSPRRSARLTEPNEGSTRSNALQLHELAVWQIVNTESSFAPETESLRQPEEPSNERTTEPS